jgi:hypothetical protein
MAAEIYSALKEVKTPRFEFREGIESYNKKEKKYLKDLKDALNKKGYTGKNVGEVLKFQVADGYAQYMVVSMRPLRLMHLDLVDGYSFGYAHLLTATEVNKQIKAQKEWDKLFSSKM